jgi:hypothetical protein
MQPAGRQGAQPQAQPPDQLLPFQAHHRAHVDHLGERPTSLVEASVPTQGGGGPSPLDRLPPLPTLTLPPLPT